jgi:hypothetical protein
MSPLIASSQEAHLSLADRAARNDPDRLAVNGRMLIGSTVANFAEPAPRHPFRNSSRSFDVVAVTAQRDVERSSASSQGRACDRVWRLSFAQRQSP